MLPYILNAAFGLLHCFLILLQNCKSQRLPACLADRQCTSMNIDHISGVAMAVSRSFLI